MPCNCDYMEASSLEIELSRTACLLDELDGKRWARDHWRGYHPRVYNNPNLNRNDLVAELCGRLQGVDVTKHSLEMQIWWRNHQLADIQRLTKEMNARRNETEKVAALAKLTPHERKLLGLDAGQV